MSAAPSFRDFALLALDLRAEQGIRGLVSERNRFETHICFAPFAKKPITEIRPIELRDWLRTMQQKKAADTRGERELTDETVKRAYALVRSIFACAVEREVIERTPCTDVRLKKRAVAPRVKWGWLTLEEQKLIVACDAIPYMDRLFIRFAIGTGMRQGELSNLELPDLHIGVASPFVDVLYGSKDHKPPKNGKTRQVQLFGDALEAARLWSYELATYAPNNPRNLVFPTTRGRMRPIGKPFGGGPKLRQYLSSIGITRRIRFHDLRHTFCSNLASGVLGRVWSLSEIRDEAGHSSVTQTERYAHLSPEVRARAGRETTFVHGPVMPIAAAKAEPIDANDFGAVAWDEAVSA